MKFIFVGKSDSTIKAQVDEFTKRLSRFTKIQIIEVKEEKVSKDINNVKTNEAERIFKYIKNDFVIVLDETGKQFSSIDFSEKIKHLSNIAFIVGGANGISEKLIKKANLVLSLSIMTLTHQMVRPFLLEQVYRAYTIQKNIPYHK